MAENTCESCSHHSVVVVNNCNILFVLEYSRTNGGKRNDSLPVHSVFVALIHGYGRCKQIQLIHKLGHVFHFKSSNIKKSRAEKRRIFRYLGVTFDSHLRFDKQINNVVRTSFFQLRLLAKVKRILSRHDLEKAIHAQVGAEYKSECLHFCSYCLFLSSGVHHHRLYDI